MLLWAGLSSVFSLYDKWIVCTHSNINLLLEMRLSSYHIPEGNFSMGFAVSLLSCCFALILASGWPAWLFTSGLSSCKPTD